MFCPKKSIVVAFLFMFVLSFSVLALDFLSLTNSFLDINYSISWPEFIIFIISCVFYSFILISKFEKQDYDYNLEKNIKVAFVSCWIMNMGMFVQSLMQYNAYESSLIARINYIFTIFACFYYMMMLLTLAKYQLPKIFKTTAISWNFVLVILLLFTDLLIQKRYYLNMAENGPFYFIISFMILFYPLIGFFMLIKKYFATRSKIMLYFCVAVLFTVLFIIINVIVLSFFSQIIVSNLLFLYMLNTLLVGVFSSIAGIKLGLIKIRKNVILYYFLSIFFIIVFIFFWNVFQTSVNITHFISNVESKDIFGDFIKGLWIKSIFILFLLIILAFISYNILTRSLRNEIEKKTQALKKTNNELVKSKKQIEIINKNLDKKVNKRTKELRIANKKILNLLDMKSKFINQVAHDLRTPLTPISVLLPLLKNDFKKKNKNSAFKKIDTLINNTKYLKQLVKDTLNISKIDSGNIEIKKDFYSIYDIVNEVIENNLVLFEKENVNIINEIGRKLPKLKVDKLQMQELLNNLITNSVKFMKDKTKKQIVFKAVKKQKFIELSLSDNGVGIEKKDINNIFDEFYKVDSSRHEAAASSGLGLSICKRIIELHSGKIWAESKGLGKGTTMKLSIPVV